MSPRGQVCFLLADKWGVDRALHAEAASVLFPRAGVFRRDNQVHPISIYSFKSHQEAVYTFCFQYCWTNRNSSLTNTIKCSVWGSHSGGYEEYHLLAYNAV
jgi:hypothetical protein